MWNEHVLSKRDSLRRLRKLDLLTGMYGSSMRPLLKKLFLLVPIALATQALVAQQVNTIVSGRTAMYLNSAFQATIESYGATFSDLGLAALQNGTVYFPISKGVIDVNTVAGELRHGGGLVITADGRQIKLLNWVLDTTGPVPTISALFVIDGTINGRFPLFLVQPPPNLSLPLQPQGSVVAIRQASLFLTPAGATTFNNLFGLDGSEQLQAYTPVGNIDVYAVLAGTPTGLK